MLDAVLAVLPESIPFPEKDHNIRIAVVGRPNTGKSTLINKILGQERVLVSEVPGTTADTVDTIVQRGGKSYLLVDTAGVRRKSRVNAALEHYSVLRALSAVERCHVCLLLVDSVEGLVEQDVRIAGLIHDRGRGLVLCLNKWDLVEKDHRTFDRMVKEVKDKIFFFAHVPVISISGLTGQRIERVFDSVDGVFAQGGKKVTTRQLNDAIEEAVERFEPHLVRGRRLKFYYVTQVGAHPPSFVMFCNRPGEVRDNYVRYLERKLREEFGFEGTPIRLFFRRGREDRHKK
jgi:GTP-binding protein